MQHRLVSLLFKDGVYKRRKTIETFCHAVNRDLEPLEAGRRSIMAQFWIDVDNLSSEVHSVKNASS
jgi:hypothetical protein